MTDTFTHVDILRKEAVLCLSDPSSKRRAMIVLCFVESVACTDGHCIVITSTGEYTLDESFYEPITGWWTEYLRGEMD